MSVDLRSLSHEDLDDAYAGRCDRGHPMRYARPNGALHCPTCDCDDLERIWRRDLGLEPLTAKQAAVAFVVLSGLLSVALWFAFAL